MASQQPSEQAPTGHILPEQLRDLKRYVEDESESKNILKSDLEQQQDPVLDKLAQAWIFVLELLVEEEEEDQ